MGANMVALIVCLIALGLKLPRAIRGYGRLSTVGVGLIAGACVLTVPPVYTVVDGALGGVNLANVLLRVLLFCFASVMAVVLSRIFGTARVERFVMSWAGMGAIIVCTVLEVVILFLSHPVGSAAGVPTEGREESIFEWYIAIGYLYPAALAGAMIVPMIRHALQRRARALTRVSYWLMIVGVICIIAMAALFLLQALKLSHLASPSLRDAVTWGGVITFVSGLALHSVQGWIRRASQRASAAARSGD